jgi:hypothetical protein
MKAEVRAMRVTAADLLEEAVSPAAPRSTLQVQVSTRPPLAW